MKFLLADTEIELIPPLMHSENLVVESCKRKGKSPQNCILDYFEFPNLIKKYFPEKEKRMARLYIPYFFARLNEESVVGNYLPVDYAVHTKNNIIIERDEIGDIVDYDSFKNELENKLNNPRRISHLNDYLSTWEDREIAVLHPRGRRIKRFNRESILIIGGFAEGDYLSDLKNFNKVSVYDKELTVPATLELVHSMLINQRQ